MQLLELNFLVSQRRRLPSGVIGHPMTCTHEGVPYIAIYYGVGGCAGVGLAFDLTAGLGAVARSRPGGTTPGWAAACTRR